MDSESGIPSVVIDNGSGILKAGFAGEDNPRSIIPSIIGRPRQQIVMPWLGRREKFIGSEAQDYRGILSLRYPMEHGVVTSWDDMELLWEHVFRNELRIQSDRHPVLITEPPQNPKFQVEKITQIMFETFGIPAMYVAMPAVLALAASGWGTGVVLDCGDGVTQAVPIDKFEARRGAIQRINFGGRDLTTRLSKLLVERGYWLLNRTAEQQIVREIKESLCYVAFDFGAEEDLYPEKDKVYELPDGSLIKLGSERYLCAEALFQPMLADLETPGVHCLVLQAIQACDVNIRKALYGNVQLTGGTTMCPGFQHRLHNELQALAPLHTKIKMQQGAPADRTRSVWSGGSILASLSTFQHMWISHQEYEEAGPKIVHRKCI